MARRATRIGAAGVIAAASMAAGALAQPRPSVDGAEPLSRLPAAIAAGEFPKTTSVLIMRGGRLTYERYFGAGSPDLLNDTRSATKTITALAVGAAIADGALGSADDPAFAYLGDLRPFANDTPAKEAITLADLMTMSSALDCNDNDDASPGQEDKMHQQPVWARWAVDLPTRTPPAPAIGGARVFAYCTTGAVLTGQIVQRAVRRPIDQYIQARILEPLGISRWQWPRSPAGEVMTGGGLRLTSRDLAKVAWMMADHGRWRGRQVLAPAWLDRMLTSYAKPDAQHDYGYFIWGITYATTCGPVPAWYMAGNGGNAIVILKDIGAAVVVTRMNYNTHGMHDQTIDLMQRYVLPSIACKGAARL